MTSIKTKTVTQDQADQALVIVAKFVGKGGYGEWVCAEAREIDQRLLNHTDDGSPCHDGHSGPVPTGYDAYYNGSGIYVNMTWDWPSSGETPTILGESGFLPEDWAYSASIDEGVRESLANLGLFAEPYSCYALCLYVDA